ncbi:MAG: hypothetical protein BGO96_12285 [Micrococcales bacterium 73-15]|uniref:hypothetical protein n=1 Tax=Salana multivorans TaxID=120377 RepID=UPI0009652094|nr:hypothetical protein [Salana multivorans]OJX97715.1 MAG: hypothetical protein BGO96_12285 [Micrococcales bacterium 73-15]
MAESDDVAELHARIARLEERNRELDERNRRLETESASVTRPVPAPAAQPTPTASSPMSPASSTTPPTTSRGRVRGAVAAVLLVVSVLLAPVATLGTWARVQLVDTDRFVETFAPLVEDPGVQDLIVAEVSRAVEEGIDLAGIAADLESGILELGLPPRAQQAAGLLVAPAVEGVRSLITSTVERVVTSPRFARVWTVALEQTHARAVAVLRGDDGRLLALEGDQLSLQLGVVVAEVRAVLIEQGFAFAERIPEVDRSIPIVTSQSLGAVASGYRLAVAVGWWLPFVVLGLLALGLALARDRRRGLARTGAGYTVALALLAVGLALARRLLVRELGEVGVPVAAGRAMVDQVSAVLVAAVTALLLLSVLVAVGAWLLGDSRPATAARSLGTRASGAVRAAMDRGGLDPRGVGRLVERGRRAIVAVTVVVGVGAVLLGRPVTPGRVLGSLAGVLVVLALVEIVRRPVPVPVTDPGPAADPVA